MLRENEFKSVSELLAAPDQIPATTGIYLYVDNIAEGKVYVGQSVNLRQRFLQHYQHPQLKNRCGFDVALKDHPAEFDFCVLIYGVDATILTSLETTYIERYHAVQDGYNLFDHKDTEDVTTQPNTMMVKEFNKLRTRFIKLNEKFIQLQTDNRQLVQQNQSLTAQLQQLKDEQQ